MGRQAREHAALMRRFLEDVVLDNDRETLETCVAPDATVKGLSGTWSDGSTLGGWLDGLPSDFGASRRSFEVAHLSFHRAEDGRPAEMRSYVEESAMMRQLDMQNRTERTSRRTNRIRMETNHNSS